MTEEAQNPLIPKDPEKPAAKDRYIPRPNRDIAIIVGVSVIGLASLWTGQAWAKDLIGTVIVGLFAHLGTTK